jgi:hypothetical protein
MAKAGMNLKIRNGYSQYLEVVNGQKIATSPITLEKGVVNNSNWLGAEVEVQHSSVSHEIYFIAEKSIKCPTNFKFKLRAQHFAQEPIFRFDSDGATHRNDLESIPLSERQVTTPHFHKFNENGINFANKTDVLKTTADAQAIVMDINFGLAHFSTEANLQDSQGKRPIVQETQTDLPIPPNQDPVAGIKFE